MMYYNMTNKELLDRVMEEAVEHLTALEITIEGRDRV
jgi:hypothetical protein